MLNCGRCGTKVTVVGEEPLEYVKNDGVIYCNDFCYKNRFIPMDISKKGNVKKKKLIPAYLHIVKDYNDYYDTYDKYGNYTNGVVNIIINENQLPNNITFTLRKSLVTTLVKHKIKEVFYNEINNTEEVKNEVPSEVIKKVEILKEIIGNKQK